MVRPRTFYRLGSIALAVSVATGAVAAEADYDSFGARTTVAGTEAEMPRFGFTGREHDDESGLIYFRARHYDSGLGQFLQRDPIGFAAGDPNLYAYVWNDPYNWTDPSGLNGIGVLTNIGQGVPRTVGVVSTIGQGVLGLAQVIGYALSTAVIFPTMAGDGSNDDNAGGAASGAGTGAGEGGEGEDTSRNPTDDEREALLEAGREADRGGRTKAGRAAEKHGSREGSAFPPTSGPPSDINDQGQETLGEIVNNPGSTIHIDDRGRTTVWHPDGRGAQWNPDGSFKGFREPES